MKTETAGGCCRAVLSGVSLLEGGLLQRRERVARDGVRVEHPRHCNHRVCPSTPLLLLPAEAFLRNKKHTPPMHGKTHTHHPRTNLRQTIPYSISQQFSASFIRCARRCGGARTGGGLGLGRGGEACEQQLRAVVQGLVSAPVSESSTSRSETTNSTM